MADRAQLAKIALSQVGVTEVGGNNCGPDVRKYQAATWLHPDRWPWCAAFVDWCVREWAKALDPLDPLFGRRGFETWRPRTAGAFDLENWAKQVGHPIFGETARAEAGDIVIFDMSHCGIVLHDAGVDAPMIVTVEGNTGPTGLRESNLGDGVFRKVRSRPMVRSFIRLVRA